jgi:hypothetical protein
LFYALQAVVGREHVTHSRILAGGKTVVEDLHRLGKASVLAGDLPTLLVEALQDVIDSEPVANGRVLARRDAVVESHLRLGTARVLASGRGWTTLFQALGEEVEESRLFTHSGVFAGGKAVVEDLLCLGIAGLFASRWWGHRSSENPQRKLVICARKN